MKVRIKFIGMFELFPDCGGEKEIQADFLGSTIKDLLHHLCLEVEPRQKEFFLNGQEEISPMMFVRINGNPIEYSKRSHAKLRDDDFVELIFATGG